MSRSIFFKVWIVGVVGALNFSSAPALGVTPSTIIGHGNSTCATYIAAADGAPEIALGFQSWIMGYLSGLNAVNTMTLGNEDFLNLASPESIIDVLSEYCHINPKATVAKAANAFYFSATGR